MRKSRNVHVHQPSGNGNIDYMAMGQSRTLIRCVAYNVCHHGSAKMWVSLPQIKYACLFSLKPQH